MLDKRECIKAINTSIEKITGNITEILASLKTTGGSRLEEMACLVFAKKKTSELTESLERIFQNLVTLKLLQRNFEIKQKSPSVLFESEMGEWAM